MSDNILISMALEYSKKGWVIFSLLSNDKRPAISAWQKSEAMNEDTIKRVWNDRLHNIGVITGHKSGIFVLDVDVGNDKKGLETLEGLEKEYGCLDTYRVRTISGGLHLYFQYPLNLEIRNKVNFLSGLDIRGEGGYVVAPPSIVNGKRYEIIDARPPIEAPQWLLKLITGDISDSKNHSIDGTISKGQRNDSLFRQACSMRARGADDEEIAELIHEMNKTIVSPPLPNTEVDTIINQACQYERGISSDSLTDVGNAERFVRDHSGSLLYCSDTKQWHIWDGKVWKPDQLGAVANLATNTVQKFAADAKRFRDGTLRDKAVKWSTVSMSKVRLDAMIALASARLAVLSYHFDNKDYELNTANCIIDLKTCQPIDHDPTRHHAVITDAAYNADATCPAFEKFMQTIFQNDAEMIAYIQRIMGYLLTGDTSEQCLFILLGDGRNGKSTLLNVIVDLLGGYLRRANANTFLLNNKSAIRSDIARLAGCRVVTGSEASEDQYWDEVLIKDITGGEKITARRLYQNETEFSPKFKILIAVNSLPRVRGTDGGIWRRIRIIPFDYIIDEWDVDPRLGEKLHKEMSGILNFALEGLRQWQKKGLEPPSTVKDRTNEYRKSMDSIQEYIEERCTISQGGEALATELYNDYSRWAKENNHPLMTQAKFGRELTIKGFKKDKKRYQGTKKWTYSGLSLAEFE